jgi:hypothetical protein
VICDASVARAKWLALASRLGRPHQALEENERSTFALNVSKYDRRNDQTTRRLEVINENANVAFLVRTFPIGRFQVRRHAELERPRTAGAESLRESIAP